MQRTAFYRACDRENGERRLWHNRCPWFQRTPGTGNATRTFLEVSSTDNRNRDFERCGRMREGKGEYMNEETFQKKLAELVAEIGTLPTGEREKLQALADETKERHKQLKQTVSNLQESIDFLRLSIKYMLFDLEATRRENNYLRKMLEDSTGRSDDNSAG